ncbi:MAG: 3'(2'),5'-bisphosphate nucleotidase CysQ [Pseudomonadales bacterium]|jgi:3'(2'), 5'-bisphosphate nucleotidase|nr:3'(2'),5'-bisphosphate nucleotidase CysQ [Pseudomonadales bacterium]
MPANVLFDQVLAIAQQAGAAIMRVYGEEDFGIRLKEDHSPLTRADIAAHEVIVAGLSALTPRLPILSEESALPPWDERRHWARYWLVDPLDGTKEFIKRSGEFTVNIALIDHGEPVLGVVYLPPRDVLYGGLRDGGAWKIHVGARERLRVRQLEPGQQCLRVVASRSHRGAALDAWLEQPRQRFPQLDFVSMGSSLKICLIAEGSADLYPRLSPTCEWDTAAAQAVLEAAGGKLLEFSGGEYRYNQKEDILNPYFIAFGDASLRDIVSFGAA